MSLPVNKLRSFLFGYLPLLIVIFLLDGCGVKYTEETGDGFNTVINKGGSTLGYSPGSGVEIITENRLAFKDLNRNGELDPYEDWRLPVDQRASDLAKRMSIEQIAGLMLYSGHQSIPASSGRFGGGTYDGKPFEQGVTDPAELSDQQAQFLRDDNLRHVLITSVESPGVAARWNNNMQAFVEGLGLGIPGNTSSDPRHGSVSDAEYNAGAGGEISMWPGSLGIVASFDPSLMEQFGSIGSQEYRALGITTALSPQIDLATDPRWSRVN